VQVKSYAIELWNEAKTTKITSFAFGILQLGNQSSTAACYIKNVGDGNCWVAWSNESMPVGFALTAQYYNTAWTDWVGLSYGTGPMDTPGLASGAFCAYKIRFTLQNVNATTGGNYTFTISLRSADSISG
jgi:hypothetical protein